ncbi:hypothetical protein CBR_g31853 [Chara braunii]|uniref:Uncharacterized protein n=1 Tax=Chara braunii TaxID=69332 RepID=A0A388LFY4_CHABU|nr:hypothetical protein CBR_g31853 [Chara braunii]|eukprot:GBG81177.1 hypothetical protein CBR_g31853 [Chara braunii]
MDTLRETVEMLEKKETLLQKKIAEEDERAQQFAAQRDERAAKQCLTRKKMYEKQVEDVANESIRTHELMMLVETATSQDFVAHALGEGSSTLRTIEERTNVRSVDRISDQVDGLACNIRQIQQRLSEPGNTYEFSEAELQSEYNELEALVFATELENVR